MSNEEATAELIQSIKECGQSIIDNAEKIVNDYKFQTEYIDVHISLSVTGNDMPTISVSNEFVPEEYLRRRVEKL